ncbi:MAG: T9SS type A sorting domain-containing protein [Bacteroidia bacterium]
MKTTNNLRSGLRMLFIGATCMMLFSTASLAQSFTYDGNNCDGSGGPEWVGGMADNIADPGSVNNSHNIDSFWFSTTNSTINLAILRENGGNVGFKIFFDTETGGNASENDADYAFFFTIDNNTRTAADSAIYKWNSSGSTWDIQTETFTARMGGSDCNNINPHDDKFFEVIIDIEDFGIDFCNNNTDIELTHMKTNAGANFSSSDKDETDVGVVVQSIDPDPVANISGIGTEVCMPGTIELTGETSTSSNDGGTTNSNDLVASYEWDLSYNGSNFYANHTGETYDSLISNNVNANQTVGLRITDIFGCVSPVDTLTWVANQSPLVSLSGGVTNRGSVNKCKNYNWQYLAQIDPFNQPGKSPYTYMWTLPTVSGYTDIASTCTTNTCTYDKVYDFCLWANQYQLASVTVTDDNGCESLSEIPPVPVDLVYFEGEVSNGDAILNWQTASELNSERFVIEKSYDGNLFAQVGVIEAAGNSAEILNYSMIDQDMGEGDVYYRLSQFDFDGTMEVFEPIVLNAKMDQGRIKISPNPSEGLINIDLPSTTTSSELTILDMTGKELFRMHIGIEVHGSQQVVDLTQLPKGLYYVKYGNSRDGFTSQVIQHL